MELPSREGWVGALVREGLEALESGEEGGEEVLDERVFRPVGRIGEGREGGGKRGEFGVEGLPPSDEGSDGEGRKEEEGEEVGDEVELGFG